MFRLFSMMLLTMWLALPQVCLAEDVLTASVCDVLANPAAYNHKLIKVVGNVSRGFEDFTLTDAKCNQDAGAIWLELGGVRGSQVMYCCGVTVDSNRNRPLTVEGVETTLVQNMAFDRFQRLTFGDKGSGRAKATLIGRYFSGKEETLRNGSRWMGYGHMGFFTLLVIQEVLDAE